MNDHRRRAEDRGGWVGWLLQPARRIWIAVLFLLLCGMFAFGWYRVTSDERSTCKIQARGLPAGHELAASMQQIHALLTLPPSPDAPPTPKPVLRIVHSLNSHLSAYLSAEAKQPHTRLC